MKAWGLRRGCVGVPGSVEGARFYLLSKPIKPRLGGVKDTDAEAK